MFNKKITFKIVKELCNITKHPTGWSKELNLVSWNGAPAKYDIRDWDPEHRHMSRGVTFNRRAMERLLELYTQCSDPIPESSEQHQLFDDENTYFEIVKKIGVIQTHPTGWSKELNLVSWNGAPAKYDVRDWDPSHQHMSRGVTLTDEEMKTIVRSWGSLPG